MIETIDRCSGSGISRSHRLKQSIQTILSTPIGSCVMRRDFGSRLYQLIDAPVTQQWFSLVYSESAEAIAKWEPDVTVTGFYAESKTQGKVSVTIDYIDSLSGENLKITGISLN